MILFGLVGSFFVYTGELSNMIVGIAFLYGNILFDKVDGEIARFKKIFSLRGIYLDEINHLVIPGLFFASLTFALRGQSVLSDDVFLTIGMLAALSMPFIRIGHSLAPQIFAKKFLKKRYLFTLPIATEKTIVEGLKERKGILVWFLQTLHQFQEFFMILLVVFFALILQKYAEVSNLVVYALMGLGILLPLIFIENTVKGFFQIEKRIADLDKRFKI